MVDRRLWFRHRCVVCKLLFVSERDLVLHECKCHVKPDFFSCSSCSEIFETDQQYRFHVNIGCSAHGRTQVCKVCGAVFEQVRELYEHHSAMHLEEYRFQCKVCSATFSWLENLEKHELMHQTNSSMCKTCGAIFGSMASLKVHLWKAHSVNIRDQDDHIVEMPIACKSNSSDCKSIGTSAHLCVNCRKSVQEGSTVRHDDEKPYKCPLCNWAFKYDFSYTMHMKTHQEKQQQANRSIPKLTTDMTSTNWTNKYRLEVVSMPSGLPHDLPSSCDDLTASGGAEPSNDSLCRPPVSAKKTVYIRRSDVIYSLSSVKPQVLLLNKNQEQKPGLLSTEVKVNCTGRANVSSRDNTSEAPQRSPCKKSPLANRPAKHQLLLPSGSDCSAFTCKECMITFQYDFSYMAHMKYHEKVQELNCSGAKAPMDVQQQRGNIQATVTPNGVSHFSGVPTDGSTRTIINTDGTVLQLLQNPKEGFALKMFNLPNGRIPVVYPVTSGTDRSSVKYILIEQGNDLVSPDVVSEVTRPTSDGSCIVEEVVNMDCEKTSTVLGVACMPDELHGCLPDDVSKDTGDDVAQVIVIENQDSSEYLLNSDMQLTSGQIHLDDIDVDSTNITDEPIISGMVDCVESIDESYYGVLIGNGPVTAGISDYGSGMDSGITDKVNVCPFCQAEFCSKASLQNHTRKHLKPPSRSVSKLQLVKAGRAAGRYP